MRRKKENCLPIKHAGPKAKQEGMEEKERESKKGRAFLIVYLCVCVWLASVFSFEEKEIERKKKEGVCWGGAWHCVVYKL